MKKRLAWIGAALALFAVVLWLFNRPQAAYGMTAFEGDGLRVQVADSSDVARVMEETSFTVSVNDEEGKPVSGAKMSIILSMPNMFCGEYEATITETSPGVYQAVGIPTMRGKWQAKLTLTEDGRKSVVTHLFKVV